MSEATASAPGPPPLAAANAPEALWSGTLTASVTKELERSARFLAFMPETPKAGEELLEAVGARIRVTNNAIQTAVADAAVKILELADKLRAQNEELETVVAGREQWYMMGDVTSLTIDELSNALGRQPIRDAKSLCTHLHAMIRKNLRQRIQTHPADDRDLEHMQEKLQCKVMWAMEAVRSKGATGTFHAFHLLVWLMGYRLGFTSCITNGCRCTGAVALSSDHLPHSCSSEHMREILLRIVQPKEQRVFSLGDTPDPGADEALRWAIPTFWDFARAKRVLWHVYTNMRCADKDGDGPIHAYGGICRRRWALTILAPLQEAASAEVKAKVDMLAGPKLPVELVELVLDAALTAEELPSDTSIWQAEMAGVPDLVGNYDNWSLDMSLGRWKIKDDYRCSTYVQKGKAK